MSFSPDDLTAEEPAKQEAAVSRTPHSTEKYQRLLQMLPSGIMYMDSDRRITEVNDAAAAMFDMDKASVIGDSVDDHLRLTFLTDPDPAQRYAKLKQNGSWVGEIQAVNKNTGKKVTVISQNKLIEATGTEQGGNVMVFTDITERRTAEERMLLAVDGTAGGLWDWDMEVNVTWWSPRYMELLGYGPDEIVPSVESFERLVHPEDGARFHGEIGYHCERHLKRFETELRYLTRSGTYKWFQVFARIKYNDQGIPARIAGSIIDIDDKKRAQEMIKLQADLFKIMPDATLYGKRDLTITDMNHAAEQLFDIKRENGVGRKLDELVTVEILDTGRDAARKDLWGEKGEWRGECLITTASGRTTKLLASAKAIKDDTGEAIGWLGIYTDISLLQINEELKEALQKEEDSVRYLEQLAYISTHDLKAPIVAAQSLMDILVKRDAVKEEHKQVLDLIKGTLEQMRRTNFALNDILKVRQDVVSKKSAVQLELATLSTIMNDVQTTLQKSVEEKGGVLNVALGDNVDLKLPYVHFKSILYNLTSNAVKYADPKRPPVIHIKAEKHPDGALVLSIEDNGLGIDLTKHQSKLFGVFKRFHTHVEGSGVGLHIVKSIIEIYEGEIVVKSQVGVGTTFDISIPAAIIAAWN